MPKQSAADDIPFLVVDLTRLLRAEFDRRVNEAGLSITAGEARILMNLARCGPIRQHLLAERIGISRMSLTNYLDRLEMAGLVRRDDDPGDRRAKSVCITDAADPLLNELEHIRSKVGSTARGSIGEDDWHRFAMLVREARSNLADARCSPHKERKP
jgi:MarR family transcriptional regulator, transcriptional regulator for hemolysin